MGVMKGTLKAGGASELRGTLKEKQKLNGRVVSVGEDGGYYSLAVEQVDETTLKVSYTPSKEGMPAVDDEDIKLPKGKDGKDGTSVTVKSVEESTADGGSNVVTFSDGNTLNVKNGKDGKDGDPGKTAYQYAKDGGYTGTENEFAVKLAAPFITPKMHGAKGDGVKDDTAAFQTALASADLVNVTKGTYVLSDTITIRSGCKMVLDRDVHLKFTQTDKHGIVMQKFAILDGGNGSVSVPSGFTQGVIVFDTDLDNPSKTDVFPYASWSPMQKYGRTVRNLDIVRTLPNGRLESDDGSCSGTAIYLHANGNATIDFLWACIIDHVNICGAFSYGIRAVNDGGWIHDTKMESVYIDSCEVGVSLENMKHSYVDCIIQPRAAFDGTKYAKQGLKLINSQHCMAIGLKVWDWQHAATGDEYKHIAMYGNCGDFVFADMTYDNYPNFKAFLEASVYTNTPANYDSITLINEPNNKWFYNDDDVPYFRKESGVEQLATFADLQANFGTSIVPDFKDWLSKAINRDGTIYNGIGYKKGYRVDMGSGEEVADEYNTYTATGFIPVQNNDVIRFANFSMWVDGYCGYVVYDANFNRLSHLSSQALTAEHNVAYNGTVTDENGNIVQFTLKSVAAAAYIRLSIGTKYMFANPAVSRNEEITYSAYGTLSPNIAVDYKSLINVPASPDLSIYQSKNIVDAGGYFANDTVDGALQEIGGKMVTFEDAIPTKPEDIGALPSTYTPPNQTAEQVGADPEGTAANVVTQHNTADDSHNDIRLELKAINDRLTAFFDSDNQTLDELSEIVAYITSNKTLIDSITTSKVGVSDIINNLTTNVTNKPLSAAQGVALKALIDAITVPTKVSQLDNDKGYLTEHQSLSGYAKTSDIPTKVSQLTNDKGYLTEHQSLDGYAKTSDLPNMANYQAKSITDAGGYFGTDTVDGALQEIGSQLNGLAAALEALL